MRSLAVALAVILALPSLAWAHSARLGDVMIGHMWAMPTGPEAEGAMVFMPLLNNGENAERLVGASSPAAGEAYLRKGKGEDAERLEALDLEPGQPVALAEWREHIWLEGLEAPLKVGDRVPLTLHFENAGQITVDVWIETEPGH